MVDFDFLKKKIGASWLSSGSLHGMIGHLVLHDFSTKGWNWIT